MGLLGNVKLFKHTEELFRKDEKEGGDIYKYVDLGPGTVW